MPACMLSCFSHVQLFATPWTVALQAPLSGQEYWSGLPCPPPGDLPNPGIEPMSSVSPALQADSLPLSHHWKPNTYYIPILISRVWYWQQDRKESRNELSHRYLNDFEKKSPVKFNKNNGIFNKYCQNNWLSIWKNINLSCYLTFDSPIWCIDLNIKFITIKLTEENVGEYLCNLGKGKHFFNKQTPPPPKITNLKK